MLSGVGEAKALRSLGIDVVENLPGVGENLQDHVLVSGVVFKYKGKMPDRPADSNAVEAEAYLSSGPSSDTDINLVLLQLPNVTPEAAARYGAPPADAFTIMPALVQPTSRGAVRLASDNFQDAAVIDCNYLGTVVLFTNSNGVYLGDPILEPVFGETGWHRWFSASET
jgi:choline dehydrogenase